MDIKEEEETEGAVGAVEAEGVGAVETEIGRALIQGNLFILLIL